MSKLSGLQTDLQELEAFLQQAKSARARRLLQAEINVVKGEVQHETEAEKAKGATSSMTATTSSVPAPTLPEATPVLMSAIPTSTTKKIPQDIAKYAWDQSSSYVKIYATVSEAAGNLAKDHCELQATEKSFTLVVHAPSGKDYRLSLGPLGGIIKPADCSVKTKDNGSVTVSLKKADSTNWANILEKKDDKSKVPSLNPKEDNPEAGLMNMMQKLYDEGDDDMKRMMQKAWYESRSGKKPDFSDPMAM